MRSSAAILLLFMLVPGANEAVVDLAHLFLAGHTLHASGTEDEHSEADHSENDAEHGCNGPFHVCSCHTTQRFAHVSRHVLPPLGELDATPPGERTHRLTSGFHHLPDKPPRA